MLNLLVPQKVRYFLRTLLPDYWSMLSEYSLDWDVELNNLLDKYDFSEIGDYTARLGPTLIWIANHPFASFECYSIGSTFFGKRPKRTTIVRAYDRLKGKTKVKKPHDDLY